MNNSQISFLQSVQSQLGEQQYPMHSSSDTGSSKPEDNNIAVLDYYGFLNISGPETSKFLQGQTTCDLHEVDDTHSKLGACCTPKGRMISSFLLARTDSENYLLRMRRDLVETTQAALTKYIVFSKATQNNSCTQYTAIGMSGKLASSTVFNTFGKTPTEKHGSISSEGNIVVQLDDYGFYFECWIRSDQLEVIWPSLSCGQTLQDAKSWELAIIRQGQGEVSAPTSESFIPQMLNYQITNAISFTKGCYTGQEVVARMQYKGKLKRHMYHIQLDSNSVKPGDDLFSPMNEQSIGKVVNVVKVNNQRSEALAVITRINVEADNVGYKKQTVPCPESAESAESNKINQFSSVKILSLPYTITELT